MDRLPMQATMPAELAEVLSDRADRELNVESFHGAARDSLIQDLLSGESVGYQKLWLRDVLDSAIDSNYRGEIHSLAEMFSGLDSISGDDAILRLHGFQKYINALVERFVDGNAKLVEDRATALAEQADEASHELSQERE